MSRRSRALASRYQQEVMLVWWWYRHQQLGQSWAVKPRRCSLGGSVSRDNKQRETVSPHASLPIERASYIPHYFDGCALAKICQSRRGHWNGNTGGTCGWMGKP